MKATLASVIEIPKDQPLIPMQQEGHLSHWVFLVCSSNISARQLGIDASTTTSWCVRLQIVIRTSSILAACCVIGWYSGRSIAAKDVLETFVTRTVPGEIFLVSAVVYSGTGIPFNFRISWTRSDLSRHQHSAADWNLLLCYHHHQLI
jgi:hypothetical protein